MKIINTTTNKSVDISLRRYRGGFDCDTEPDALQDLAEADLNDCPRDEDGNPMMSADMLKDFIDWWTDEVARANTGRDGDGLQGLTEAEIDRGDEWMFIVNE